MIRQVITGEYRPRLEEELLRKVGRLKSADPLNPILTVVPTNALGLHLSRYIATELGGHAEIRFMTLLDLARRLGGGALAGRGLSALPPLADLVLLRGCVETYRQEESDFYFGRVSETPGFIRVLLSAITDLKEGCISPADLKAAAKRADLGSTSRSKVLEVVRLWSDYEKKVEAAGFYDRADLTLEAASRAEADRWLAGQTALIFYGFYDLNPLQRLLARRCADHRSTYFFVPFLDTPAFEYARPTISWLKSIGFEFADGERIPLDGAGAAERGGPVQRGGSGESTPECGCGSSERGRGGASPERKADASGGRVDLPRALHRLREGLFGEMAGPSSKTDDMSSVEGRECLGERDGLTIISAAGEERECREIVREVLRGGGLGAGETGGPREALRGSFKMNEVGVLLRDPSRHVVPLSQILEDLGVEPFIREGLRVSQTRAGRSLILLTEIVESDLARRPVMDFLTYADLNPEVLTVFKGSRRVTQESQNPAKWDLISMEAGIVKGLDQWRDRLSAMVRRERLRLGRDEDEGPALDSPDGRVLSAHEALLEFVECLSRGIESIRRCDGPESLVKALSDLCRAIIAPSRERDGTLETLGELSGLGGWPGSLDLPLFFWLVREHLESVQVKLGSLRGEGPVLANLMRSRGLPFKIVVVPGLTEGLFPAAARQDPILLDGERANLNSALAKIGSRGRLGLKYERLKEEKLLFRLAAGSASELLILSYSRVEPASGSERIPSEFVLEAASVAAGERCNLRSLEKLPAFKRIPIARLFPEDDSFLNRTELDLKIADRAVSGDKSAVEYLAGRCAFLRRAVEAERMRREVDRLTPYDGLMESPEALRHLKNAFHGRHGVASPTSLELYCECPFLYFMRHILRIEPLEDPEEVLSITPLELGSLAHKILERTFKEIFSGREGPKAGWKETLASVASGCLDAFRGRAAQGLPLLWELDERRLAEDLASAVAQDLEELGDYRPWKMEVRYGLDGQEGTGGALDLSVSEGMSVAVGGKIDRVDLDAGAGRARVIDYKTGKGAKFKDNSLRGGTTLQLPLYVLGAQSLLGEKAKVVDAQYYFVTGVKRGKRVRFTESAVRERMADLIYIVGTVARGVESGLFFAYPGDSCRYCEYKMACLPAQAVFERKQSDPRAQEFLRMREIE